MHTRLETIATDSNHPSRVDSLDVAGWKASATAITLQWLIVTPAVFADK
jgi:hypothetical protein